MGSLGKGGCSGMARRITVWGDGNPPLRLR